MKKVIIFLCLLLMIIINIHVKADSGFDVSYDSSSYSDISNDQTSYSGNPIKEVKEACSKGITLPCIVNLEIINLFILVLIIIIIVIVREIKSKKILKLKELDYNKKISKEKINKYISDEKIDSIITAIYKNIKEKEKINKAHYIDSIITHIDKDILSIEMIIELLNNHIEIRKYSVKYNWKKEKIAELSLIKKERIRK